MCTVKIESGQGLHIFPSPSPSPFSSSPSPSPAKMDLSPDSIPSPTRVLQVMDLVMLKCCLQEVETIKKCQEKIRSVLDKATAQQK